GLPYNV
ncbi:hypothetical protein AVEN_149691-1, partial [Araneus ventricosus]